MSSSSKESRRDDDEDTGATEGGAGIGGGSGKVAQAHNSMGDKPSTQLNQGRRTPESRHDRDAQIEQGRLSSGADFGRHILDRRQPDDQHRDENRDRHACRQPDPVKMPQRHSPALARPVKAPGVMPLQANRSSIVMGQKSERTVALTLTSRLSATLASVREGCQRRFSARLPGFPGETPPPADIQTERMTYDDWC